MYREVTKRVMREIQLCDSRRLLSLSQDLWRELRIGKGNKDERLAEMHEISLHRTLDSATH